MLDETEGEEDAISSTCSVYGTPKSLPSSIEGEEDAISSTCSMVPLSGTF